MQKTNEPFAYSIHKINTALVLLDIKSTFPRDYEHIIVGTYRELDCYLCIIRCIMKRVINFYLIRGEFVAIKF